MSHEIDMSNDRANIAYVGDVPWHGLGTPMTAGQTVEQWWHAAGLDWTVNESPVMYQNGELRTWDDRKVLYRSDTGAPLSVMGKGFHVVQPSDVRALYSEIAKAGGFELETAGALSGGKRIWALARVSDGADIVNGDRVRPYILLATSFDGTMATIAKFTAVRVVCHNTISMAVPQYDASSGRMVGGGEKDSTEPGKQTVARVIHAVKWNDDVARDVRLQLGIVHDAFERFVVESRALASKPMNDVEADAFVAMLMEPFYSGAKKGADRRDVRETRGYKRVMELFAQQEAIGAEMAGRTRWGMLNAVTQLIDHERGKSDATRLDSAWFGTGNAIKSRAFEILNGEFHVESVERVAA